MVELWLLGVWEFSNKTEHGWVKFFPIIVNGLFIIWKLFSFHDEKLFLVFEFGGIEFSELWEISFLMSNLWIGFSWS
jgi:hypothetical protein